MNDTAGIADERLREIVAAKSVLGSIAERQALASELLAARQEIERLTLALQSMTDLEELQARSLDAAEAQLQTAQEALSREAQSRDEVVEECAKVADGAEDQWDLNRDELPTGLANWGPLAAREIATEIRRLKSNNDLTALSKSEQNP